jgi:hypothetical protein
MTKLKVDVTHVINQLRINLRSCLKVEASLPSETKSAIAERIEYLEKLIFKALENNSKEALIFVDKHHHIIDDKPIMYV